MKAIAWKHCEPPRKWLNLVAETTELRVTDTHRVMIQRGQQIQDCPAGILKKGDRVIVSGDGNSKTEERRV